MSATVYGADIEGPATWRKQAKAGASWEPPATVAAMLRAMCGVWHEKLVAFGLDGAPLDADPWAGAAGPSPFENLVYVDLDGDAYRQTNVTIRGRPLYVRSFTGRLVDGVLRFDKLGPDDPDHVGVSAGPGALVFSAARITDACARYHEPDLIRLLDAEHRTRATVLYRGGVMVRTLTGHAVKLTSDTSRRVALDARGDAGEVHGARSVTQAFSRAAEPLASSPAQPDSRSMPAPAGHGGSDA